MALKVPEIIKSGRTSYLHLDGFLYYKHSPGKNGVVYWRCKYQHQCSARVSTLSTGHVLAVRKGGDPDSHTHAPNREEVSALQVISGIKRTAEEHPEAPPAQVLRVLQNVPSTVMAELPDRENIRKMVQRRRLRGMPTNPQNIEDLGEIPETYRTTLAGESFLLYDSYTDDYFNLSCGRILVFSTRENLQQLFRSRIWFVDGTFKTTPTIFFQLFAIMGSVVQVHNEQEQTLALPFVYSLLESKEEAAYSKVLEVTLAAASASNIAVTMPQFLMTDFELGIINAATKTGINVHACFFHLRQSIYRKIQSEGLQSEYNDEDDRSIKKAAQMMGALAFVPAEKIPEYFDILMDEFPDNFVPVAEYFEVNYIRGKPARGRRRALRVRYAPILWNQYDAVLQRRSRTNNASEAWHNRLQVVVGRYHPSLYIFLSALQQEQGDTEGMLRELNLGQRIRPPPAPRRRNAEERIFNLVSRYDTYDDLNILEYLQLVGHYIQF